MRVLVVRVMAKFDVSERRACDILGQNRSTQRYPARRPGLDDQLARELKRISKRKPSWGYRRAHRHLKFQLGWDINVKRVQRVWRDIGLAARPAPRKADLALGSAENAVWNRPPTRPNDVWTMDFMQRRLTSGRKFRIFNVVDEFTRRGLGELVEHSIGKRRVQEHLVWLFRAHGKPGKIRTDNGTEFVPLKDWLAERGIELMLIEKGKPQQNAYMEAYNSLVAADLLSWEQFDTLLEARTVLRRWRTKDYNREHRHGSLHALTPNEFTLACRRADAAGESYPPSKLSRTPRPFRTRETGKTKPES